jgi:hypothetical protein
MRGQSVNVGQMADGALGISFFDLLNQSRLPLKN